MSRTDEVNFIKNKFEPPGSILMPKDQKILTLNRLVEATVYAYIMLIWLQYFFFQSNICT